MLGKMHAGLQADSCKVKAEYMSFEGVSYLHPEYMWENPSVVMTMLL